MPARQRHDPFTIISAAGTVQPLQLLPGAVEDVGTPSIILMPATIAAIAIPDRLVPIAAAIATTVARPASEEATRSVR
jgi:hypothetical protein